MDVAGSVAFASSKGMLGLFITSDSNTDFESCPAHSSIIAAGNKNRSRHEQSDAIRRYQEGHGLCTTALIAHSYDGDGSSSVSTMRTQRNPKQGRLPNINKDVAMELCRDGPFADGVV